MKFRTDFSLSEASLFELIPVLLIGLVAVFQTGVEVCVRFSRCISLVDLAFCLTGNLLKCSYKVKPVAPVTLSD